MISTGNLDLCAGNLSIAQNTPSCLTISTRSYSSDKECDPPTTRKTNGKGAFLLLLLKQQKKSEKQNSEQIEEMDQRGLNIMQNIFKKSFKKWNSVLHR